MKKETIFTDKTVPEYPTERFDTPTDAANYYFYELKRIQKNIQRPVTADKLSSKFRILKIQDAINEIMTSRGQGILTGEFYWKPLK